MKSGSKSSPLSVRIRKDLQFRQRPAKCIGDYNHDSFCGGAVGWIRYISLQSMDRLNVADMRAGVGVPETQSLQGNPDAIVAVQLGLD